MLQIFVNETFENRTLAGTTYYLLSFGNFTLAVIALIEAAQRGDPLYLTQNLID